MISLWSWTFSPVWPQAEDGISAPYILFPEAACDITTYHKKARTVDMVVRPCSGSLQCVPSCDGGANSIFALFSHLVLLVPVTKLLALLSLLHGCGAGTQSPAPFRLCPKVNLVNSEIRNIL